MKRKDYTKLARNDPNFVKEMRELAQIRYKKGLAKFNQKDLGMTEMTRLLTRTEGWKISKEELKTKPKKENLI